MAFIRTRYNTDPHAALAPASPPTADMQLRPPPVAPLVAPLASTSPPLLRDRNMAQFTMLIADMWQACGTGRISIDRSSGRHGFLAVQRADSPMQDIGPSGHVGDDMFVAIIGGFLGSFAEAERRCVQSGDTRLGDREGATFIVGSPELSRRVEALRADGSSHAQILAALAE